MSALLLHGPRESTFNYYLKPNANTFRQTQRFIYLICIFNFVSVPLVQLARKKRTKATEWAHWKWYVICLEHELCAVFNIKIELLSRAYVIDGHSSTNNIFVTVNVQLLFVWFNSMGFLFRFGLFHCVFSSFLVFSSALRVHICLGFVSIICSLFHSHRMTIFSRNLYFSRQLLFFLFFVLWKSKKLCILLA